MTSNPTALLLLLLLLAFAKYDAQICDQIGPRSGRNWLNGSLPIASLSVAQYNRRGDVSSLYELCLHNRTAELPVNVLIFFFNKAISLCYCVLNRCLVPECETAIEANGVNYKPPWLNWSIPFGPDNEPEKCYRYEPIIKSNPKGFDRRCEESSFEKSNVIQCETFVFQSIEAVTIVNEVNTLVISVS